MANGAAVVDTGGMADSKQIAIRLPGDLLAKIEARQEHLRKLSGIKPTLTDVIKIYIERGIAAVEADEKPARKK